MFLGSKLPTCLEICKQFNNFQRIQFKGVVNDWNKLPKNVVETSSVNMFKNRLDQHEAAKHAPLHQNR